MSRWGWRVASFLLFCDYSDSCWGGTCRWMSYEGFRGGRRRVDGCWRNAGGLVWRWRRWVSTGGFSNYFDSSGYVSSESLRGSFGRRVRWWSVFSFGHNGKFLCHGGRCSLCHEIVDCQMSGINRNLDRTSVLWRRGVLVSLFGHHSHGLRRFVSNFGNCTGLVGDFGEGTGLVGDLSNGSLSGFVLYTLYALNSISSRSQRGIWDTNCSYRVDDLSRCLGFCCLLGCYALGGLGYELAICRLLVSKYLTVYKISAEVAVAFLMSF